MGQLAYLSLGSNLGDKLQNLDIAIQAIESNCGKVIKESLIYKTPPLGFDSEDNFLNMCISIEADLEPLELLNRLKKIEIEMGREKKSSNGVYVSRIIDIDIILFGNHILNSAELTIPHPRYTERRFVISPLRDISGSITDPLNGKTVKQLFDDCIDESCISIYER